MRKLTLAICVLSALALGAPAAGQSLGGRVLEEGSERPVREASVELVDREGDVVARSVSDVGGRWTLPVERAGEYYLVVTRLGYETTRSPLLAIDGTSAASLDLLLTPSPIGLEGLRVEVDYEAEAEQELRLAGIAPRDLGRRWISEEDVAAVRIRRDVGTFVERQGITSLRVIRPENLVPGSGDLGLCVSLVRARTAAGFGRCALGVVDGIPRSNLHLLDLDPETVAAMAVLLPTEAVILYGKRGEGGAVLIWTKQGGADRR